MGKSILKQIERKGYWGIVGTILALIFGSVGVYSVFHEKKPSLLFEITNEANVLDVYKPLDNLKIIFENEDIQEKKLNLKIVTVKISNDGEINILQSYFDHNIDWGFRVYNAKIIDDARILNSSSSYIQSNLKPSIKDGNTVNFKKIILEKGAYFTIEVLLLHNKNIEPTIKYVGKIAGINFVPPVYTWREASEVTFFKTFFYGGFKVTFFRGLLSALAVFASLLFLGFLAALISIFTDNIRTRSRKRVIYKIMDGKPKNDKLKYIADSYIKFGYGHIKYVKESISNPERLKVEIILDRLNEEYNEKLMEIDPTDKYKNRYRHIELGRFDRMGLSRRTRTWLELGIIEMSQDDEVLVDNTFRLAIKKILKELKP